MDKQMENDFSKVDWQRYDLLKDCNLRLDLADTQQLIN